MNMLSRTQVPGQPWWSLLARGIIAVLFGLAALFWPGLTLLVLIYIFGAFALVEGIITIYLSFQVRDMQTNWWMLLLEGIAGVILGILVFIWPGITALVLLFLIAAWAVITGIIELVAAFTVGMGWLLAFSPSCWASYCSLVQSLAYCRWSGSSGFMPLYGAYC